MQNQPNQPNRIVHEVLSGHARALNLPDVPPVLMRAKPAVFDAITLNLTSFLVFYAHHWEQGEVVNKSKLCRDWEELTGYTLDTYYVYRLINEVFNRQILSTQKPAEFTRRLGMICCRRKTGFYENADVAAVCV